MSKAGGKKYYKSLDGLRGLAILLVLIHHLFHVDGEKWVFLDKLVGMGWVGVELFFVLSGFLITGILLDSKESENYFSRFYVRRTLRIFPAYYFFLIVLFLLFPVFFSDDQKSITLLNDTTIWYWLYLTNMGMLFDISAWLPFATSHLWSLAIEEQFYLFWPILVFWCDRKMLIYICVFIVVGSPFLRFFSLSFDFFSGDFAAFRTSQVANYLFTPFRFDGLALGALIACGIRSKYYISLKRSALYTAPVLALLLLGLVVYTRGFGWVDKSVQIFGFSILSLFFGSILLLSIEKSKFSKLLENKFMCFFGKYSYSMYIFHMPVGFGVSRYFSDIGLLGKNAGLSECVLIFLLSLFCTIALSLLSWVLIESRCLRLKERFF